MCCLGADLCVLKNTNPPPYSPLSKWHFCNKMMRACTIQIALPKLQKHTDLHYANHVYPKYFVYHNTMVMNEAMGEGCGERQTRVSLGVLRCVIDPWSLNESLSRETLYFVLPLSSLVLPCLSTPFNGSAEKVRQKEKKPFIGHLYPYDILHI